MCEAISCNQSTRFGADSSPPQTLQSMRVKLFVAQLGNERLDGPILHALSMFDMVEFPFMCAAASGHRITELL